MSLPERFSKPLRERARHLAARMRFRYGGNPVARKRASAALKALGGGIAYGALVEPSLLQTTQIEIPIPDLPPSLDGLRIAHLTDLHYNFAAGRAFLERVVAMTNALDPDLVALTGDFITHKPDNLEKCLAVLDGLHAPDGRWVVRGNHDYRVPMGRFASACEQYGFHVIENRHVLVRPARARVDGKVQHESVNQPAIVLAGVGDMWEGECLPGRALEGAHTELPTILLSHHAEVADILGSRHRVDLVLSGHTHGGQIRAGNKNIPMFANGSKKYVSGLIQTDQTIVYISRGVGTSALRFRWNCRPEIALIVLHRGPRYTP